MKRQKHLSILMILVLSFTTFINPMVAFADSDLEVDNKQIELEKSGADAVIDDVVVDEVEDESEENVEQEEIVKQEEKALVKNKGDPSSPAKEEKNKSKSLPKKEVAKDVTEKNNTKEDGELEKGKKSKSESIDVEKNKDYKRVSGESKSSDEKHIADMTDDERDSLGMTHNSYGFSRFLTDESYITPLKDPTSNYEGELSFEFEISNDFELEHNRIYVINKYASQLRDFVLQPDVKSVWNDGVRWAPSSTKDNQGKPNMYYSLRDDGKVWIIFSRDLANSSNRSGYLEFNFYHNCVEKKILKDGEEVDYAEFEEGEEITFLIRTVFDEESPGGFNRLTDVIDDRLILAGDDWQERRESVRVYDQRGKEYPDFVEFSGDEFIYDEDGYASIDYKQVTFKGSEYIDEKIEKVDLHGKTFTMEIKAKIKESANYGEEIPNIADIDGLESNEVIVKKIPPKTPEVVKDVEGEERLEIGREKEYNYNVKTNIPKDLGGYKDLTIADTLDKRLDVVKAKVLVDGKASDFEATIKGQTVTLKLDRKQLDTIAGKEINLQITAKIQSGTDIELIDNKATIQLNDNPDIDSNVVTVIPPSPVTPDVIKDVEGEEHLEVAHEKAYNYNVKTNVPTELGGYEYLTLTDVLDNRLDVVGAKVLVDGKASDFEAKIDGQKVTLKLDRKQLDTIAGKEINLQITAKIKSGTDIELIDNKATIQLNDNPIVDSNVVTVIPPKPEEPMPETPEEQKPEEPKQPEQKQKVEVKPEEPVEKAPEKEEGKKLPKTASDMFNYLALGLALFLVGGTFYFVKRKNE